jgi:hypothetical protein
LAALIFPFTKSTSKGWEETFQHDIPAAFDEFQASATKLLEDTHNTIQNREELEPYCMLLVRVPKHCQTVNAMVWNFKKTVTKAQRESNRLLNVQKGMRNTYQACAKQVGTYLSSDAASSR